MEYIDLKYTPGKGDLVCKFLIEPEKGVSLKKAANGTAAESSVGTWTKIHSEKAYMRGLAAKVFSIKGNEVKISYPQELFEPGNIPQILSSIAGNIFGMKIVENLRLEDIVFPEKLVNSFKGPEIGLNDIRKVTKVKDRPLVGTIVKPKVGLNSKDHARVAYEAWAGGLDLVKCDENLTSQSFNRFETNLKETYKMLEKAEKETGERKIYVPNVTAETKEMIRRAKLVKEYGGNCIMVDIITTGWAGFHTIRNENLNIILHGHRAGHGMFTKGKHGMSMMCIAKIARLIGVSQLHTGTIRLGKMFAKGEDTKEVNSFLKSKWYNIKPVLPIASGGLWAGSVPKLIKILGNDIIIQAGGGVHSLGTRTGAASMRQAVDATTKGVSLDEYSKTHKELFQALKHFR